MKPTNQGTGGTGGATGWSQQRPQTPQAGHGKTQTPTMGGGTHPTGTANKTPNPQQNQRDKGGRTGGTGAGA